MARSPPRYDCEHCGEPMYLLQPACEECGEQYVWQYEIACHSCGEPADYTGERCPACDAELPIWRALEVAVLAAEGTVGVWKESVPRPTEAGYRYHLGSIHGQWADYRRPVEDGEFHVRSYTDHYEIHCDDVSAVERPAGHLLRHGPTAVTGAGFDLATRLTGTVIESGELATRVLQPPAALRVGLGRDESEKSRAESEESRTETESRAGTEE